MENHKEDLGLSKAKNCFPSNTNLTQNSNLTKIQLFLWRLTLRLLKLPELMCVYLPLFPMFRRLTNCRQYPFCHDLGKNRRTFVYSHLDYPTRYPHFPNPTYLEKKIENIIYRLKRNDILSAEKKDFSGGWQFFNRRRKKGYSAYDFKYAMLGIA